MRLTSLQRSRTLVCDAMILVKKRITKQSQLQKQPPKREKTMSTFDEKQGLIQNASIENPDFYFKGSVLAIGGTPKDCFFCNLSTPVDANLLTQKLQKHLDGEDGNKYLNQKSKWGYLLSHKRWFMRHLFLKPN